MKNSKIKTFWPLGQKRGDFYVMISWIDFFDIYYIYRNMHKLYKIIRFWPLGQKQNSLEAHM